MEPRSEFDYKKYADNAIKAIRDQLTFGSNAEIDSKRSQYVRTFFVRSAVLMGALITAFMGNKEAGFPAISKLESLAIKKYGYGQCGEQSHAVFLYLVEQNVFPIHSCSTSVGMHELVVLGGNFTNKTDISDCKEGMVCDAWINNSYPLIDFHKMQQDEKRGVYALILEQLGRNPIHYLKGALIKKESIESENDLKKFKKEMVVPNEALELFNGQVITIDDLVKDFAMLSDRFNRLASSSLQYDSAAIPFLLQIKSNLASIPQFIKELQNKLKDKVSVANLIEIKKQDEREIVDLQTIIKKCNLSTERYNLITRTITEKNFNLLLRQASADPKAIELLKFLLENAKQYNIDIFSTGTTSGNAMDVAIKNKNEKAIKLLTEYQVRPVLGEKGLK